MIKQDMAEIYKLAKQVYLGNLRQIDAKQQIQSRLSTQINDNSFIDFCTALRHMLNGTRHTRGISTDLREYYLEKILEDFGVDKLRIALNAYMMHIEYYENKRHTHRKIEREIHSKFSEKIGGVLDTEIDADLINELKKDKAYFEGGVEQVIINKYSRSSLARQKCIEKFGTKCCVCGFAFEEQYGELGKGFIHVHHLVPISSIKNMKEVTCDDLRPVCPNCHAMLHKGNLSVDELKGLLKSKR